MKPCICTYTGKQFYPLAPKVKDVCIEDIAHALSNMPRFAGHTSSFHSVADHSILVSNLCKPEDARYGLLHDASEAYIMDMPAPIKHSFENYKEVEHRLLSVIYKAFDLDPEQHKPASVAEADKTVLRWEQRDLMPKATWWNTDYSDIQDLPKLETYVPWVAEKLFLERFKELFS